MKNPTKADLVTLRNTLVEEADAKSKNSFKNVAAVRNDIELLVAEMDAVDLAIHPSAEQLAEFGFDVSTEDVREPEAGTTASEKEKDKPRRFTGQADAGAELADWYEQTQPKRGEFGSHCHDRVYIAMDVLNRPATKADIAAYAGTKEAVVANAIHDFRNCDRYGKSYHTPENKRVDVKMKRINGEALYALDARMFDDVDTGAENAEAATQAMAAAESKAA